MAELKTEEIKNDKIAFGDFLVKYNKVGGDAAKERFVAEKLKVKSYLPYAYKTALAKRIVESTCLTKDNRVVIDSPAKHVTYVIMLISSYTNIEFDYANSILEYDKLKMSGVWKVLFEKLPQEDIVEFDMILEMTYDDFITNHYDIHSYITNTVDRVSNILGIAVSPALEKLADTIDNIDPEKAVGLVEKLKKHITK